MFLTNENADEDKLKTFQSKKLKELKVNIQLDIINIDRELIRSF